MAYKGEALVEVTGAKDAFSSVPAGLCLDLDLRDDRIRKFVSAGFG